MNPSQWVEINYKMLYDIAKNVNQGKGDHEDLLHYALEQFLTNSKAQGLVDKGHAKWFVTRILNTSAKSKTSGFWRENRPSYDELDNTNLTLDEPYDLDKDNILEWLAGILEDMKHGEIEDWYRATILQLCMNQPKANFSELSRETGIPRTSIANAYYEGIKIVQEKINEYGSNYSDFRNSLINYLSDKP